jgi:YegS/Rv2252/BmrU family lipid kinase
MADLDKAFSRLAPDPLCRRIGRDQLRVLRFEVLESPHHRVVLRIRDFGAVEHVVEVLMAAEFAPQLFNLLARCLSHPFSIIGVGRGRIASYQNTVLIYNPVSGKIRRNPRLIQRTIDILREEGIQSRGVATTGPRTAGQLARKAVEEDVDLILVAGGDGTINEVINGVAPSHVPVGLIPAGTANVLASELGLGTRLESAVREIPKCVPQRIALGLLRPVEGEQRYFISMAGAGLDARIVYDVSAPLKAAVGKLAYWAGGFSHLVRPIPQFETALHCETIRCGFALASRVKNYGGDLEIACGANLLEDEFEVVLFQGRNPLRYMMYFLAVVVRVLPRMRGIKIENATRLQLNAPEDTRIYVQVDGELAGHLPASIEIVPDALSVLVPADFRNRTPARVVEGLAPA